MTAETRFFKIYLISIVIKSYNVIKLSLVLVSVSDSWFFCIFLTHSLALVQVVESKMLCIVNNALV